jgi:hypothetical protein
MPAKARCLVLNQSPDIVSEPPAIQQPRLDAELPLRSALHLTTISAISYSYCSRREVNTIENVPNDANAKVQLLSRAWGVTAGEVVARLVENFASAAAPEAPQSGSTGNGVPIYVVYESTRVDAIFDPPTKAVTILSGKLTGKTYASPSGAAVAVVAAYNPTINPNRNGWVFWFLAENGALLQSIRKS